MERLSREFSDSYEITFAQGDDAVIAQELPNAEVIIGEPNPSRLGDARQLKWMQITWAGADRYTGNFPENVILTNASGAFGRIISEYTLGMILAQYKRLPEYYVNQKNKIWADMGQERSLLDKRVLILGTGNVGSNIAQKLHAFGTYNIGINRSGKTGEHFDQTHKLEDLDALLPTADIVIGALPRTSGTIGLFDYRRMQLMKEDALLVNVGRGTMIVTKDLEKLLEEGITTIFYPSLTYNVDEKESENHYNCPVVAYYAELLQGNMDSLQSAKFLYPYLNINSERALTRTLHRY